MKRTIEAFCAYLAGRGFRAKTITEYRRALEHFHEYLRQRNVSTDVRETKAEDITAFISYLHRAPKKVANFATTRYSERTIENMQSVILHFFAFACRHEYILTNPAEGLEKSRRAPKRRRQALSRREVIRFIEGINGDDAISIRDRAIAEMLYGTGIRAFELCALETEDADLSLLTLRVRHGKGERERLVPFEEHCRATLARYVERSRGLLLRSADTRALFVTTEGKPLKNDTLQPIFRRRCAEAKIKAGHLTPHVLRHSYATHLLENGASVRHIQMLLGHTSLESTVIYTHFTTTSMKRLLRRCHPHENALYRELDGEEKLRLKLMLE